MRLEKNRIPALDIGTLWDPSADRTATGSRFLQDTVEHLHQALKDPGFLYIQGHGIPRSTTKNLFTLSKKFFSEPEEFKNRIKMEKGGLAWRGFFPVGGELTSGRPDQKEGVYFGRELDGAHPEVRRGTPLHGPNQWPEGAGYAEFQTSVLAYMDEMTRLGQALMEGVALALGLPRNYFRARFTDEPTTLFRIFNYPTHTWKDADDEWGVREHTDMGFLTILLQDDSGGLQVKSRSGDWIAAPPVDDTFVVNIGDMLEVWTHGIYRATPHRVRNAGGGDRLSLPFFFDPNWNTTLERIDRTALRPEDLAAVEAQTARRWDGLDLSRLGSETTYGDFVWKKVRGVFPQLVAPSDKK